MAQRNRFNTEAAQIDHICTEQLFAWFIHFVKRRYGNVGLDIFGYLLPIAYFLIYNIYNMFLLPRRGNQAHKGGGKEGM